MFPSSLDSFFQNISVPYGVMLPICAGLLLALIALPGILRGGNAWESVHATFQYLAASLGIILVSTGSLPVLQAVLSGQLLSNETYIGLLFVFAIGGILFLWHDTQLRRIDATAKAVPRAIVFFTWKLIGVLISVFALLSLLLSIVMRTVDVVSGVTQVTMLIYGLVLCWFTQVQGGSNVVTTRTLSAPSVAAKKPSAPAKKGAVKRKK